MKYRILSLSLILLTASYCCGQSVTPNVISSGGSFYNSGNITLSSTVGEAIIQTFINTPLGLILTQGFQQPDTLLLPVTTPENVFAGRVIKVSPNPTTGPLKVQFGERNNNALLYIKNIMGQELAKLQFNNTNELHCTLPYEPGIYVLEVLFDNIKTSKKVILINDY